MASAKGKGSTNQKESHAHHTEWDPMKGVAESLLNSKSGDEVIFGGVGGEEISSIICPFNDGTGRCFKTWCPYKHVPYSSKDLRELPKLQYACDTMSAHEPSRILDSIPRQIFPANGCVSKVVVVSTFDPGCFYVISENGWRCLCGSHEQFDYFKDKDANTPTGPDNFFDALEHIQSTLKSHFDNHPPNLRSHFSLGELVAVRMSSSQGPKSWYRAIVVEEPAVCDDDTLKAIDIKVELLDYGTRHVKNSQDVVPLPEGFCNVCPLAYKCQLFGLSPILGTWSSSAIKEFEELVKGCYAIAEVVRTATPTFNTISKTDNDSCFLNLCIKKSDETYIDVTKHLADSGFGIEWNMFPAHTKLNEYLDGRVHKFALIDKGETT